jgi:Flp pilus assembly protein TadG
MFFVVPLFMALVLGLMGLADLLITEQLLGEASGRGARTAALGGSEEQVKEAVRSVLGKDRADKADIVVRAADGTEGPVPPGGLLEVRVELKVRDGTATGFAPVARDEVLIGRTVMQRE